MNKRELLDVLAELDLQPSRRLGQNFLIDANLLQAIVRAADPRPGERILEVGPGTGALTEHLLAAGARVTAVEYDHRLYAYLENRFGGHPGLTLIQGDACRLDYEVLLEKEPFRCIANLPYSCSSPFLARLLDLTVPPGECLFLLQREMALRLGAKPDTKAYGSLTVRVALRYETVIERTIGKAVFHPAPEVDSALVRLTRHTRVPASLLDLADRLATAAFSQRRKRVERLLLPLFPADRLQAAFVRSGISPDSRAEHIPPEGFVALAACLQD